MKFVVELKKTIESTVVVDAANVDELDKKLMNGEYERRFDREISDNTYLGMSFVAYERVQEDDRLICSIEDFADWFSNTTPEHIERDVFKYTDCGMPISWDDDGITLVGYVECDCDFESPHETLKFPFLASTAKQTIRELETLADAWWHELNDCEDDDE